MINTAPPIETHRPVKRYGDKTAVNDVSFQVTLFSP